MRFHRDFAGTLPRFCRDHTETPHDFVETLLRRCNATVEFLGVAPESFRLDDLAEVCQDMAETLPIFCRDFASQVNGSFPD